MNPDWKGVFHAVTTQFQKDQSLDLSGGARLIEHLILSGAHGLILIGPNAESASLTRDERLRVVEMGLNNTVGRVPLLAAISETGTRLACRLAKELEQIGVDGIFLSPPSDYAPDETESVRHVRRLAESISIPILVSLPAPHPSTQLWAQLRDLENVVGVHLGPDRPWSAADINAIQQHRLLCFSRPGLTKGEQLLFAPDGWVAANCQAFPQEIGRLWQRRHAATTEETQGFLSWLEALDSVSSTPKAVQRIKCMLHERGLGSRWVREPRLPLTGAELEQALRAIRQAIKTSPQLPTTATT